ncbi:IS200/IS605 family transposase, partial [Ruthenibacterium lactatiformans]|uniref:IS200/IS605 family transposase n=2 Tax=Ruthenibacterium lactatiformans TaxID=1550024 RepID=UPI001FAA29C7
LWLTFFITPFHYTDCFSVRQIGYGGKVCPDHIHMLVEIPPKMSVAGYIGFLKGRSSLMIFQRHGNLKYKYGNRSFWCRGYYVDTAGKNTKKIAQYIQNQLKEDQLTDQMTLKEYMDPLAGNK